MKKLLATLLGILSLPLFVFATTQITVPSAPAAGYALISTSTGAYVSTSTPWFLTLTWGKATSTAATTTSFFATTASTTNLFGQLINGFGLSSCAGATSALTWGSGSFGCHTISTSAGSGNVATSTNEVANQIPVFSSNSATPATIAGYSGFTWNNTNTTLNITGSASTTGMIEAGGNGGVEIYNMGSGIGTLGFNSRGYTAGVAGYGALFQLAPSTGTFSAFLESNVSAGAAHSHTTTFSWDNTGTVTIPLAIFDSVTRSTTTAATTTSLFATTASTTNLFGTSINGFGLSTCTGTNALTWTGGGFTCTAQPQGTVTSVTGTWPIISSGGATPAITWGGLATTSNPTAGNLFYSNGTNGLTPTATSTLGVSTGLTTISGALGYQVGGSNSVIGLASIASGNVLANISGASAAPTATATTSLFTWTGTGDSVRATSPTFVTGITSPLLIGGTAAGSSLSLQSTSGVGTTDFIKFLVGNAGGTEAGRINTLGNVGLGTTTPQWKLQIASSTGAQLTLSDPTSLTNLHWSLRNFGGWFALATSSATTFATSSTNALTINNNGFLGVASNTPTTQLSVGSGAISVAENQPATSTTPTIDWRNGNQQLYRHSTSATTISFSNYVAGQKLVLLVCNAHAGTAGTITWDSAVMWSGGSAPTQTTTADKCDIWSFMATNGTSTLKILGAQNANF